MKFRRIALTSCVVVASIAVMHAPQSADAAVAACNRCFVTAASIDFLDRAPVNPEFARQVARLASGNQTDAGLVEELASSPEWVSAIVERFYADTLGRSGDPAGVAYWSGRIRSKRQSVAQVAATFYASTENYNRTGGSPRSWLTDLYRKLLLRSPDVGGLDHWIRVTASSSRARVAFRFFQSTESRTSRVKALYVRLLGRPGEPAGVAYWVARIATAGDVALAVNLASSPEYELRSQRRFPLDNLVIQPVDPTLDGRVLTPDVADSYALSRSGDSVHATAPASNTSSNTRVAFAPADASSLADEQSCATWSGQSADHDQEGAALRLVSSGQFTKGITVTKNIWLGGTWIFNVHLWDTSALQEGTLIASFDLSSTFRLDSLQRPFPWTLCARVVADTVSFIVWPATQPSPSWDNPYFGGSVMLPSGWNYPGAAGWYIGHLGAGDEATFDGLRAGPVPGATPAPAAVPWAPISIASMP